MVKTRFLILNIVHKQNCDPELRIQLVMCVYIYCMHRVCIFIYIYIIYIHIHICNITYKYPILGPLSSLLLHIWSSICRSPYPWSSTKGYRGSWPGFWRAEGTDGDTFWLTEKLWNMAHLMGFIMGFNEIYLLAICYI